MNTRYGRGDKIRTCDFYVPNVALYQAEPHLDGGFLLFFVSGQTCGQTTYNGNFISFYTTEIVNVYKGSRRFEKSQNTSRRLRPERSALPS